MIFSFLCVSKKIANLRQGLGAATCNVAEYKALLLGLKYAHEKGFKNIQVQGDSNLVVKMVFLYLNICNSLPGLAGHFHDSEIMSCDV